MKADERSGTQNFTSPCSISDLFGSKHEKMIFEVEPTESEKLSSVVGCIDTISNGLSVLVVIQLECNLMSSTMSGR